MSRQWPLQLSADGEACARIVLSPDWEAVPPVETCGILHNPNYNSGMKLLLLLLPAALLGQSFPPPSAILKGSPPGGAGASCSAAPSIGYLNTSAQIYTCSGGVWTLYSGSSSGGGTVNAYVGDHTGGAGDCGNWATMSGSSLTFTLPSPPISSTCQFAIQNLSTGSALTISRNGLTINGDASDYSIPARSGSTAGEVMCWTDGTNYFCSGGAAGAAGTPGGSGITVYSGLAGITLTSATVYFPFGGGSGASATEANVQSHVQSASSVSNLGIDMSVSLGGTNTGVFTVRKNGSDTSLTCTVTAPSLTCSDTTSGHAFTTAAGDTLDVKAVFTGTISSTPVFVINAQAGTSSGGGGGTPAPPYLTISSVPYGPIFALTPPSGTFSWLNQNGSSVTTPNNSQVLSIVNTSGTDHLTCYMQAIPGAAGADYTAQIALMGNQNAMGAGISDGTKVILVYNQPNVQTVFQKWNSTTSFSGNYYAASNMGYPSSLFWIQFQQSGATRTMKLSADGVNWVLQSTSASVSKDDFLTETMFGACMETNASTAGLFSVVSFKMTNP